MLFYIILTHKRRNRRSWGKKQETGNRVLKELPTRKVPYSGSFIEQIPF